MRDWIEKVLAFPGLEGMGHGQRVEDANLGFGWLYYALGRIVRPRTAVVIGSFRGFVPIMLGRALMDNLEGGVVHFIDPSMVDDFWMDPAKVKGHFESFGVTNVRHHLMTTQEFATSTELAGLGEVGILFVDGYHTEAQARFDHATFAPRMSEDGVVLFHDTVREGVSRLYGEGKEYARSVTRYMQELRSDSRYQTLDIPIAEGVLIARRRGVDAPSPPRDNVGA